MDLYGSLTTKVKSGLLENPDKLYGILEETESLYGTLSNIALRGEKIMLRMDGSLLQYKYESDTEWIDLIDLSTTSYNWLKDLPTLNGVELRGEIGNNGLLDGYLAAYLEDNIIEITDSDVSGLWDD